MSTNSRADYEPGTSRWATRQAQWLALGLFDADILRARLWLAAPPPPTAAQRASAEG